jgi:transcriptional regulator with XRE-family HTH domain
MNDYEINFRLNLKRLRTAKGYSQDELAQRCGLDRTYISLIERGKRSPSLSVMSKISVSLDVHLAQLISKTEL